MNSVYEHQISVGHFIEDASYGIERPNGREDYLIILTLRGVGEIGFGEKLTRLERGEAVLFHPGCPQSYRTATDTNNWEFSWSHFQPSLQMHPFLAWPEISTGLGYLKLPEELYVEAIFKDFEAARLSLLRPLRHRKELAQNRLAAALIQFDIANSKHASAIDERILRAMEWIYAHLGEAPSMDEIARVAGLSVSHFGALFKAETGHGVTTFIEDERMRRAREMLEFSRKPIGEIALEIGYRDPFYFSNRFRTMHKVSPRSYREKHQSR